jgi:hypothetical protein
MKHLLAVLLVAIALTLSACWGKSDADLQKAAAEKTKAVAGVTVAVKDGVATLTGEVATDADKTKAADLAKVEGIKSVDNKLTVKPAPTPVPVDPVLTKAVQDALIKKGFKDVTATVSDKTKLTGSVPKGKKMDAQQAAMDAGKKPVDMTGLTEK